MKILVTYAGHELILKDANKALAILNLLNEDERPLNFDDMKEMLEWIIECGILLSPNVAPLAYWEIGEDTTDNYALSDVVEFCKAFNSALRLLGNTGLVLDYRSLDFLWDMIENRDHKYDLAKVEMLQGLHRLATGGLIIAFPCNAEDLYKVFG